MYWSSWSHAEYTWWRCWNVAAVLSKYFWEELFSVQNWCCIFNKIFPSGHSRRLETTEKLSIFHLADAFIQSTSCYFKCMHISEWQAPVWIKSNLYFVRTISCTHRERALERGGRNVVGAVMAADRQDVVVLAVYVGACYSHAHSAHVSWPTSLWRSATQFKLFHRRVSLCGEGFTLGGGWRPVEWLDDHIVFFLLFTLHQHGQVLSMRQEGDR